MKNKYKPNAVELRQQGYSLSAISAKIHVSRATLSHWLRDIPYEPNEQTQISQKKARTRSALTRNRRRIEVIGLNKAAIHQTIGDITTRDLLMLGVGIYAGRGASAYERVELSTAEAKLGRLFVRWLVEGLQVPMSNVYVRLHLSRVQEASRCSSFWSQALHIPESQIKAIPTERGSAGPFGYVKIYLKNEKNGKKEFGVHLFRKVEAMIDFIAKN